MVIARIESLILDTGMNDALERAEAYINAGADGIIGNVPSLLSDGTVSGTDARFNKAKGMAPSADGQTGPRPTAIGPRPTADPPIQVLIRADLQQILIRFSMFGSAI